MNDQLIALILDESKWLTASLGCALICVIILSYRLRTSDITAVRRNLAFMNLFFGVTIGMMAFGHLLAITTKLVFDTLEGSVIKFYLIGIALAVPSWWLICYTRKILKQDGKTIIILNAWIAITLFAFGIHNFPLALPGFLNIGYYLNSGTAVGRVIVFMAILINIGLLIGSLIFLASGQTLEQFRGID